MCFRILVFRIFRRLKVFFKRKRNNIIFVEENFNNIRENKYIELLNFIILRLYGDCFFLY